MATANQAVMRPRPSPLVLPKPPPYYLRGQNMRCDRLASCSVGWVCCLPLLLITPQVVAQELPTAKPEEVGVSSEKVAKLGTF